MFDSIAPRYDLLNHVLSMNVDRLWWWRTARKFRTVLSKPDAVILDICCGTGDMTMALLRLRPADGMPILAADFAHQMLIRGNTKFAGHNVFAIEADALQLPLASGSVDLITTAFGFRNLANYRKGLEEFHRVLRRGGQFGILDFSGPGGLLGKLYAFYFRRILPAIGSRISGISGPGGGGGGGVHKFPPPGEMLREMRAVGLEDVSWQPFSLGIAGLYRGMKP
jgi:demethylmenaquinone methyltransferase/2-methoxy-6-polyprenyl-1,4-benzoquinol methylase